MNESKRLLIQVGIGTMLLIMLAFLLGLFVGLVYP
jgi:hypothetical protein